MTKQEILDDLEQLHKINQNNIAKQYRRLMEGKSKSSGGSLVHAVSVDHRLLITIATLEGFIDPDAHA